MASKRNGTLHTGVTSDLVKRVYQHKEDVTDGLTKKHQCKQLVYDEQFEGMIETIARQKQIKAGFSKKKRAMIERVNPTWRALYENLL